MYWQQRLKRLQKLEYATCTTSVFSKKYNILFLGQQSAEYLLIDTLFKHTRCTI